MDARDLPRDLKAYWEQVYREKGVSEVSWFTPRLELSLEMIANAGVARDGEIIDVGGGASTLVDHLLEEGFWRLTVLDLSAKALERARTRLGGLAGRVRWLEGEVTTLALPRRYDLWHDRAVFHFLVEPREREAYKARVRQGLKPGGQLILATFAPEGPPRCTGLPVARYDFATLARELGPAFQLQESRRHTHTTPSGGEHRYIYCRFRFTG